MIAHVTRCSRSHAGSWLPALNDTVYPVMRLYWPNTEAPRILPAGEGTWQPPAVVAQ
jgi:hypothetical protein